MFFKLMNTVNDKWNNGKEKHRMDIICRMFIFYFDKLMHVSYNAANIC